MRVPVRIKPRLEQSYSGTYSFTTHQAASLDLPGSWAAQDFSNSAGANTTLWIDFKKARGAFVPSLQNAVHDIFASLGDEGGKVYASKAQRVCGGERLGWFRSYEKPNEDPPWQYEETLFLAGDTIYRAVYSRPDGQPADRRIRAALNTLCPLPTESENPSSKSTLP